MKIKVMALLALIAVSFSSCELSDDDFVNVTLEPIPITSVEIPDPFVFGEVNEIIVRYNNPTDCHRFYAFDVRRNLNEREVTVFTEVFNGTNCITEDVPTEQILRFLPVSNGTIEFKFFSGLDADDNPQFLEYTVDVIE